MKTLEVASAGAHLVELVGGVATGGERVALVNGGVPVAVLVNARELRALDETIAMLSNHDHLRRVAAGEDAIQIGDLLAGSDLQLLDPGHQFVQRALTRASAAAEPGAAQDHWDLMVSGPARRTLEKLPRHMSDLVLRFVFQHLLVDPARVGIELRGSLSRRFCAHVETEMVIYRLDSVKRSVRLIEVLHSGGLVGQPMEPGRRW
jgi:PHD/YefM family antitoxin component YafN of YafNO toxin-antitoxin module/mRNA-degrading endonuclease RelE of RelBE toxin-antitoxin system